VAFLIDPFARTVTPWQPAGAFLPALRQTIGATQLDSVMVQNRIAAWVDNFGMLVPDQRFWRFKESPYPFAGRVIMTGVDADGMPTDAGPQDLAAIAASIDWCEDLAVVAIREELRMTPTEEGPWPRIVRITEFNRPLVSENGRPGPYEVAPSAVAPEMPPAPPSPLNGAAEPSPSVRETLDAVLAEEERVRRIWTVTSNDESDKFVATEEATGHSYMFEDMVSVASFFAEHDAERLEDDPDLPDDVIARFSVPV
jgi:hypothetical protein